MTNPAPARDVLDHFFERSDRFIRGRRSARTPTGVLRPSAVTRLIEDLPRRLAPDTDTMAMAVLVRAGLKANGDETLLAWLVHGIEHYGVTLADFKAALAPS